jgi:acyl-CoA synthetase (AMP-forming)/AMP-acid ligase II
MKNFRISELLARHAGRVFVTTDHGDYTYAQVADLAQRFAARLQGLGVGKGDRVAILAANSAAYLVAWLGTCMRGAIAATLNNQLVSDGLCYTLQQSGARVIVADQEWVAAGSPHLTADLKVLPVLAYADEPDFMRQLAEVAPGGEETLAYADPSTILYTSGTTGLPKGVVNSYAAYFASGTNGARLLELTPEDRILVCLPMFHVNPQMLGFMTALAAGARVILRPKFSATTFFTDAKKFGATGCTFVGTILSILVSRHPSEQKDHAMRFCFGGGTPQSVWRQVHDRFGMTIHEGYGMTELGGWTAANSRAAYKFGSCGKPRPDIELKVVDEEGVEVAPGAKGELVGRPRSPGVIISGYWGEPEKFVEATKNLWFHSGDQGSIDEDGFVYFHGRIKELIRRGGENVSPVEVETRLLTMPGVADCAIVGVPDPVMEEEIKAIVVAREPLQPSDVADFLRAHFPSHMVPRYVEFADRIPKTPSEKIQRHLLKDMGPLVTDLSKRK